MKDILDKVKKILDEKIVPALQKLGEKAKALFAKVKPFTEKIVPFVKENKRYFGTVGLFVCFVVMLVFFTGDDFNAERVAKMNSRTISGEDYKPDAEFEIDAYPAINALITQYFNAYVAADFTTLEAIAKPISEMEKSYITSISPFYEAYQNITCYTKHGLSKDSYIVSACFDIKFTGVETAAPSMVLFYVQTAEDGSVYINNLYSDFNMMYAEASLDKDVYTALRKYTTQDDYIALYNEVETAYLELIKENTDVYQMTKRTIPGTRQVWEDTVYYVEQPTEELESTESTETTQATEQAPSETPAESETPAPSESEAPVPSEETVPVVQKVKIVNVRNKVNIRQQADVNSADIGDAHGDDVFVKLGVETDSSGQAWTKIQFDGDKVGYIMATYTEDITE